MLIDEFLPEYDFAETHDINIRATAETIYETLDEIDLRESWIIRGLFFLRGLPTRKLRFADLRKSRFEILGMRENKEILLGLAGKFWTVGGDLQKVNSANFKQFDRKGFAKAVWDFSLRSDGRETYLTTETRIKCLDEESRRSFKFYWTFIQPFSGLIRTEILKIIKRKAEII